MTQRLDYAKASPTGFNAFLAVHSAVYKGSLPKGLVDLVYLRISQINGCAFCIDMHTRDLLKIDTRVAKLALLSVWREGGETFTPRERAALAWAESVTRVIDTHVSDDDYAAAAAEFSAEELADLTYAIALMNAFNRFGVAFRTPPAGA
ncbi:MAG: carboxymuconolactone decarboxylase family protein [Luteibacter sp.]